MSRSMSDLFAIPVDATTNSLEVPGATVVQGHFIDFVNYGASDIPQATALLVALVHTMVVAMLDAHHAAVAITELAMKFIQ